MLAIAERLERDVLAACVAHPTLLPLLAEITPEHFESETHRRFRDQLLNGGDDGDLVGLKAELDARVAREGIDERTGRQLLLRLRERRLRKDATEVDPGRQREVAEAIERFARRSKSRPWNAPSDATICAAFPRSSIGRASGC